LTAQNNQLQNDVEKRQEKVDELEIDLNECHEKIRRISDEKTKVQSQLDVRNEKHLYDVECSTAIERLSIIEIKDKNEQMTEYQMSNEIIAMKSN